MGIYTFSLKSKEQRGASQANIVELDLASDDDAALMKSNLEALCEADCVTVDLRLAQDYSLPYPDGTDRQVRGAMWSADNHEAQVRLRDIKDGTDLWAFAADLIAAGIKLPTTGEQVVTSINFTPFLPGPSV